MHLHTWMLTQEETHSTYTHPCIKKKKEEERKKEGKKRKLFDDQMI